MKRAGRARDVGRRERKLHTAATSLAVREPISSRPGDALEGVGRELAPHRREGQDARHPQNRQFEAFEVTLEAREIPRWPSISLCMIVKNEEANLRPCIESACDLASEIIVVDTGSADDTVRVARERGARVFDFAWTNDFAAARNESIRHATGEWIFWMDADDRLTPKAVSQLKCAAASGKADAFLCLVSSRTAAGSRDVTEHVRLFRNGIGITFSQSIHETVYPALVRLGLRLAITDIAIEHTGYESPDAKRTKAARNLAILDAQLERHPDDPTLVFYRGQSRGMVGDAAGSVADLQRYLELTQPDVRFNFMRFWAHASLLRFREIKEDRERHGALLESALAEFPGHPNFLLERASLQMADGHLEGALRDLERAHKALQGTVRGLAPSLSQVEIRLSDCCRQLGRANEAIQWAERAWQRSPADEGIGLALARIYLEKGRLREAETTLDRLPPTADSADRWLLVAELRLRQGRPDEAEKAMQAAEARGLPAEQAAQTAQRLQAARLLAATRTHPVAQEAPQVGSQLRGLALLGQGREMEAAELFASAIQEAPSDPDNYRYLAVALQKLGREAEAQEAWRLGLIWQQRAASRAARR